MELPDLSLKEVEMRTIGALLILLAVSGSAMGEVGHKLNSNLTYSELAKTCDPTATGESQLYCSYYMMGLIDGLSIASEVGHWVPDGTSVQIVRRAVYEEVEQGSVSQKAAVNGVAVTLTAAFPCS